MEKLSEYLQSNYKEDELKTKMDELGIYLVDIFFDEPRLIKLNPLKVQAIRSSNSDRFEDSSLIIMTDYKSPNELVDEYYDELKSEDIDYLMEYTTTRSGGEYSDDQNNHTLLRDSAVNNSGVYEDLLSFAEFNGHIFGNDYTDRSGNIRELKVRWKSLRKVQKIKYYDDYAEEQYRFESEEYIPSKELGEESTLFWINEGWEGVKLGKDIYLKMRPLSVQYVKANNPSKGHLGIIGQIYNTNQGRAVSLVDRAKNYQYMYDAVFDRLNKAIATNYGKIMELDLSKVPTGWEIEKWMHFAVVNKIAVIDSFKEGNHGAATGKLAGGFNTQGGRVMDMETGSYIQQHIQLLSFIKMEMSEVCGVSAQREGQVSNRETVGGVERAVNQSSHITEYWFAQHENLKVRVLEAFLETAKVALRGKQNKKVQYILDDQTIQVLNMEGEDFAESDYGILISNTTKALELEAAIKQYAQAYIQNGGSMSTVMDIYFSPSLLDMRRKLEIAEEELHQRSSESSQQQAKAQEQMMQQETQFRQSELELDDLKNQRDNDTKRYIAELQKDGSSTMDSDNDGVADGIALDKLDLDRQKRIDDFGLKMKALNNDMSKHKDQMDAKKIDQSISRIKKKSI